MAEKDFVIKEKLEYSGLFDFPSFYAFAHNWFKETGYGVTEEKYSEKTDGHSRDISIEWKATKNFSDYFKAEHTISFRIGGLVDVEAEIDKVKKKMNRGSIFTDIKGTLIKDPQSKWEASVFSRFWRDVYNKYIIPSRIQHIREEVETHIKNFKEELKAYLELTGRR
jgi:hypothetical protein